MYGFNLCNSQQHGARHELTCVAWQKRGVAKPSKLLVNVLCHLFNFTQGSSQTWYTVYTFCPIYLHMWQSRIEIEY